MKLLTGIVGMALLSMALVGRCSSGPAAGSSTAACPGDTSTVARDLRWPVVEPSAANVVIPELIKLLSDPRRETRLWAADSLGKIGPEAKEAVPALQRAGQGRRAGDRQSAAEALGRIGPAAEKADPGLWPTC